MLFMIIQPLCTMNRQLFGYMLRQGWNEKQLLYLGAYSSVKVRVERERERERERCVKSQKQ